MSGVLRQAQDERSVRLELGDCLDILPRLRREGVLVDAVVTDPPYHLVSVTRRLGDSEARPIRQGTDGAYARASAGFMGQKWDGGDVAFRADTWKAVMAVMKPGAWLVAFGGTRTFDLMAGAVRAAGFDVRDRLFSAMASEAPVERFLETLSEEQRDAFALAVEGSRFGGELAWIFGSGFPKSHDVSKGIDKLRGAERAVIGERRAGIARVSRGGGELVGGTANEAAKRVDVTAPATEMAAEWNGWGTALKPACEPILLARKPLDGSVAENVLKHRTGALNIGGCRVGTEGEDRAARYNGKPAGSGGTLTHRGAITTPWNAPDGRWPANVVLDGSEEVLALFPETESGTGAKKLASAAGRQGSVFGRENRPVGTSMISFGDKGSAARFYYCAKATDRDRVYRCRQCGAHRLGKPKCGHRDSRGNLDLAGHPTVKPLELMRWLVRLVTPPGGLVLDPFAGTGTTGQAAAREGMSALLIERERDYAADICVRLGLPPGDLAPAPAGIAPPGASDHGPLFGSIGTAAGPLPPEAAEGSAVVGTWQEQEAAE